jgi:hypothetical protein
VAEIDPTYRASRPSHPATEVGEAYETRLLDAEEWQSRRRRLTEIDRTGVVRIPDAPAWDEFLRSGASTGVVPAPKPDRRDDAGTDKPPDRVLEGDRKNDWTQHSFDGRTRRYDR